MRKRPIEFIAILYMIVWTISPPLQIGMIYRLAALGCAALLFKQNGFLMTKQHGFAMLFCMLAAACTVIIKGSFSAALSQIGIYMLFIGYVMNYWYEYDWEDFSLIVPIVLLMLAFWNFKTVSVLATDPNAARYVVRDNDVANAYLMQGVGGYTLMYCQVMIVPAIVGWIITVFMQNKVYFACGVVWAVSYISYLAEAGYSIAVTASLIGVIILFAYKRKELIPAVFISLVLLAILVYLISFNDTVRGFLLNTFDGTKVAMKIADITSTVTTDETADSIAGRILRYQASLRTIFHYPVIGSWWNGGAGGHSALLDAFAQYGIFGGVMMCRMVYCVPLIWKRYNCSNRMMQIVNATMITISFVAWLDTIPFNLVMTLTVVLPIILHNIESWSTKNEYFMDS